SRLDQICSSMLCGKRQVRQSFGKFRSINRTPIIFFTYSLLIDIGRWLYDLERWHPFTQEFNGLLVLKFSYFNAVSPQHLMPAGIAGGDDHMASSARYVLTHHFSIGSIIEYQQPIL